MSSIRGVNVGGAVYDVTDSSNIAPFEAGDYASRSYDENKLLIRANGLLYKAIAPIAAGDPLEVNTNIARTTIDEALAESTTGSSLIAPTENDLTSSAPYAVGDEIIRDGLLYKVILPISAGSAFVVGTNIELAGSVSSQIKILTNKDEAFDTEISDMNNVLGAKNLLPNNATTQTFNGITFTVNSDGSVTANGTATAQARLFIVNTTSRQTYLDEGINYILSGCPNNSGSNQYFLRVSGLVGESWVSSIDYGSGVEIQSSIITASRFQVFIEISNGATVSNLVFKPMIRPASIKDDTYVPYAMTNAELGKVYTEIFTLPGFDNTFILYRVGKICFLKYYGTASSLAQGALSFSHVLPERFIPMTTIPLTTDNVTSKLSGVVILLELNTDGTISGYNYSGAISSRTACRFVIASYIAKY